MGEYAGVAIFNRYSAFFQVLDSVKIESLFKVADNRVSIPAIRQRWPYVICKRNRCRVHYRLCLLHHLLAGLTLKAISTTRSSSDHRAAARPTCSPQAYHTRNRSSVAVRTSGALLSRITFQSILYLSAPRTSAVPLKEGYRLSAYQPNTSTSRFHAFQNRRISTLNKTGK
jgi:hypothetical protein